MVSNEEGCPYTGPSGIRCNELLTSGQRYCFWHDSDVDKSSIDIKTLLEERASSGLIMEGFQLKGANLENVNLVNREGSSYQLIYSDLSRANLHHAHLYQTDLSHCNLLKANLNAANLHFTDLSGCNLLGADFKASRLDEVRWGKELLQEQKAFSERKKGNEFRSKSLFHEAEEVARNIRRNCESQGLFDVAGRFFHREMVFRRNRYPRWSFDRHLSLLIDLISGYGEKPQRVILFSLGLIVLFSFVFMGFGIVDDHQIIAYSASESISSNFLAWLDSLYYSVVTFTTLGYGDVTPYGFSRFFAALEAFTGSFTMALFVVVFVKKMAR